MLLWIQSFLYWSSSGSHEQEIDFYPARTPLLSFNLNQATFLHENEEEEIDYSSLELLIYSAVVSWEIKCKIFCNIKDSN